jgi:hypothetical protein
MTLASTLVTNHTLKEKLGDNMNKRQKGERLIMTCYRKSTTKTFTYSRLELACSFKITGKKNCLVSNVHMKS